MVLVTSLANSGPGSLRDAIATAPNGDTITFAPELAGQTITLSGSELEILQTNLTVDGSAAPGLVISGGNQVQILDMDTERSTLTVRNLTLANGKTDQLGASGGGAAINVSLFSSLNVDNVTFANNEAIGRGGGAIYSHFQTTVDINNSRFIGNTGLGREENQSGLGQGAGGAITIWSESKLTVRNSLFEGNVGVNGGAINNLLSDLLIENSIFRNNDATPGANNPQTFGGYGGGVYTDGAGNETGTIVIRNSRFEGNKGAGQGGGAFLNAYQDSRVPFPQSTRVENVLFLENTLVPDGTGISLGGGLNLERVPATVSNVSFVRNNAIQGGGLYVDETAQVNVANSTFSGNRAVNADGTRGEGGGAFFSSNNNGHTLTNVTMADNFAGFFGGATNLVGNVGVTATNSIFANNTAGNPFDIKQQTNEPLVNGGGNLQFPNKTTTRDDDPTIVPGVTIADPLLAALADNGGGNLTYALQAASPAINAGIAAAGITTDQRGVPRDGAIDIGAFEVSSVVPVAGVIPGGTPTPTPTPTPPPGLFTIGDDDVVLEDSPNAIAALAGNDRVLALGGADTLFGDEGSDTLFGNQGTDVLFGLDDGDVLFGGKDGDTLFGNQGDDRLFGDLGGDTLYGGQGNDAIDGGDGDDLLGGDLGTDTLTGGGGSDRFILRAGAGADLVTDYADGTDQLVLVGGLQFADLVVSASGAGAQIAIAATSEVLATLQNLPTSAIDATDFGVL